MAASTHCAQLRTQAATPSPHSATDETARTPEAGPGRPALRPNAARESGGAWEQQYRGTKDQVSRMRAALELHLTGCPVAADAILIMSELAANAVRHSRSRRGGGRFTARLVDVPGECVRGEVEDAGSEWGGDLRDSARQASGLFIVLHLAADCGVSGDSSRRVVWFRLPYPADAAAVPGLAEGAA